MIGVLVCLGRYKKVLAKRSADEVNFYGSVGVAAVFVAAFGAEGQNDSCRDEKHIQ